MQINCQRQLKCDNQFIFTQEKERSYVLSQLVGTKQPRDPQAEKMLTSPVSCQDHNLPSQIENKQKSSYKVWFQTQLKHNRAPQTSRSHSPTIFFCTRFRQPNSLAFYNSIVKTNSDEWTRQVQTLHQVVSARSPQVSFQNHFPSAKIKALILHSTKCTKPSNELEVENSRKSKTSQKEKNKRAATILKRMHTYNFAHQNTGQNRRKPAHLFGWSSMTGDVHQPNTYLHGPHPFSFFPAKVKPIKHK